MPESQKSLYNPVITGFSDGSGPLNISLVEAKREYGQLPSRYGFVSEKKWKSNKNRNESKVLNLEAGSLIKHVLADKNRNLKREIYRFYKNWHRDMASEFGIAVTPLFNINDSSVIKKILMQNHDCLHHFSTLDIKQILSKSNLIKKQRLNSIDENILLDKGMEILGKIQPGAGERFQHAREALHDLNCWSIVSRLKSYADDKNSLPSGDEIDTYADEIASLLIRFNDYHPLAEIESASGIRGKGIEFEYVTRDASYLELGGDTGDCTADKKYNQLDDVENIFWTVFSWLLDKHYQIVKVYYNGQFVMKVHLVLLYVTDALSPSSGQLVSPIKSDYVFLAVDAVETALSLRDDLKTGSDTLIQNREDIFYKTVEFVENLADAMNINHIYAETFSNTPWVRDIFKSYPEIFFNIDHLVKIDQLEDVFSMAVQLADSLGRRRPDELFMELQMKNAYLSPGYINKAPGVKSFALIRGNAMDGIPMKRVIGI